MIQVEVNVLAINRLFEVEVNEHATIGSIIEGLASIASAQAGRSWEDASQLMLCYQDAETVLPVQKTAYQCRIRPGSRLLLI